MADTKISALPAGTAVATTLLPGVNGAVTQRVSVKQILDLVGTIAGPPGADGAPGADGPAGADGQPGAPGVDGKDALHIVSVVEPAPGTEIGDLWIDPDGAPAGGAGGSFDDASPITYDSQEVVQQTNGDPIGLSPDGLTFHQPTIVAAIPVVVNGKRYLLPLCEE